MTRKVRLGLDLDGVIYQWPETTRFLLKKYWNLDNVPFEGRIEDHIPAEINKWLWNEAVKVHGLFRYGSIYKGAREFLLALEPYCDNVIITRRPHNASQDTLDWLAYQKLSTIEIHILGPGKVKSKVTPHCDVYIDDETGNCEDFIVNTKAKVIMPNKPWNQGFTKATRTFSWEEIENVIYKVHAEINDKIEAHA